MNELGSYVARNADSRDRLRETLSRLSEADYARSIGHGWTIGAALAHIAYWDRMNLTRLLDWQKAGPSGVAAPQAGFDSINDEMLPTWLGATPAEVAADVIAAAEAVDEVIAGLSPELIRAAVEVRPRSIDRSLHRLEHLDEVARALRAPTSG